MRTYVCLRRVKPFLKVEAPLLLTSPIAGEDGSVTLSSPPIRARKSGAARSAMGASPPLSTSAEASIHSKSLLSNTKLCMNMNADSLMKGMRRWSSRAGSRGSRAWCGGPARTRSGSGRGSLSRSPRSHDEYAMDILRIRAEGSEDGTEPLHPPPYRDVAPAHDEPQGFRDAPQGVTREIQINRVGHDEKGSPPPGLYVIRGQCGSGGGLPSDLCSSIGLR